MILRMIKRLDFKVINRYWAVNLINILLKF